jgi:hypothetical protein
VVAGQAELLRRLEAALFHQALAALVARLSAGLGSPALADLAALALLAGAGPGPGQHPGVVPDLVPDLPAADRAAALRQEAARRLAVVQVTAPGYQAVLADLVAQRLLEGW